MFKLILIQHMLKVCIVHTCINNNYIYTLSIVAQIHDDRSNDVQTDVNPAYETSTAVNDSVLYETVF